MSTTINYQGQAVTMEELNARLGTKEGRRERRGENEFGEVNNVDYRDGVDADEFELLILEQQGDAETVQFGGEAKTLEQIQNGGYSEEELLDGFGDVSGVNYSDGIDATEFNNIANTQLGSSYITIKGEQYTLAEINELSRRERQALVGHIPGVDASNGIDANEFETIRLHLTSGGGNKPPVDLVDGILGGEVGGNAEHTTKAQLNSYIDNGIFMPNELREIVGDDGVLSNAEYDSFVDRADTNNDGKLSAQEIEDWKARTDDFRTLTGRDYAQYYVMSKAGNGEDAVEFLKEFFPVDIRATSANAVDLATSLDEVEWNNWWNGLSKGEQFVADYWGFSPAHNFRGTDLFHQIFG